MTPTPIPEGFELISGRGPKIANQALDLAEERGFERSSVRVSTVHDGFLVPIGDSTVEDVEDVEDVELQEIVFPDPEKDSHAVIDDWAKNFDPDLGGEITFDGIEAENADKPTKAEKVAHLQKVVGERAAANDADPAAAGLDTPKED